MTTSTPLVAGSKVTVTKGCVYLGITKGTRAEVVNVIEGEGRSARVILHLLSGFKSGKTIGLWTRHINRVSDPIVSLHNGDPFNKIQLRRGLPRQ